MASAAGLPIWRFMGVVSIPGPEGDAAHRLGRKAIGLLAALALTPGGLRRDALAALLWPGMDPSRARHNLRQCLLGLRRAPGGGLDAAIDTPGDLLVLRETVGTDVGALLAIESGRPTTADELLDLCRGPLLDGFRTGAAPFDAWIEQRRARLATAATRALIGARVSGRRSGRDADRAAAIDAALAALGPVPLASTPGAPPLRVRAARPGRPRWLRPAAIASGGAALIVAAVLGTYLAVPRFHHVVDSLVIREAASPARIAVHQFTTVNGTEKEADLAGGVTLGVNYALYAVTARELFVVTSPVRATDDTHDALMEVARELRVRYLISGAVEVLGPTVRVLAQCLDAETGAVVWRRQFEKPVSDAFRLQDEITLQILAGLEIDLSTAERNRLQYLDDTGNLYAWLAAANGVRHLIRVKRRDVETAEQYYRKALEHDPNYLSAMRGLAWVRFLKVRLGWAEDPQAAILEASDTLQAILRRRTEAGPDVAPEDGLTLSLQGAVMLLAGDYDNAVRSGERALELLPGSADVTAVLAHTLTYVGEHERALALIERAMELSPLHPPWYRWTRGRALRMAGRVEESVAELERDIDREDRAIVHLVELVASYSAAGMMSKARRIAGLIRAMDPHFSASIWLRHPPIRAPDRQSIEFEYLARAGL